MERIPIPFVDGAFVRVYIPGGDVYRGVDTKDFRCGERYGEWIANDFSVLYDRGVWHMVGITHPRPPTFADAFHFYDADVHEAEYQLFHCTARGERFADVFREASFCDEPKLLYPQQRPGERPEIWAPHLMRYRELYTVVYSPGTMRAAWSDDFLEWDTGHVLFDCSLPMARDPYVFVLEGQYVLVYTMGGTLYYRLSGDMRSWSEDFVLQHCPFRGTECESPFLMKRDGWLYLFWSVYDGRNGCYDDRTLVYAARSLDGFDDGIAPLTVLPAHAPEIVRDGEQEYLLSVYSPYNGVSAARLGWR